MNIRYPIYEGVYRILTFFLSLLSPGLQVWFQLFKAGSG